MPVCVGWVDWQEEQFGWVSSEMAGITRLSMQRGSSRLAPEEFVRSWSVDGLQTWLEQKTCSPPVVHSDGFWRREKDHEHHL